MIENIYTLKVINQRRGTQLCSSVSGVDGIRSMASATTVNVDGGGVLSLPVRARAHRDNAYGIMTIQFHCDGNRRRGMSVTEDSRFLGPTP